MMVPTGTMPCCMYTAKYSIMLNDISYLSPWPVLEITVYSKTFEDKTFTVHAQSLIYRENLCLCGYHHLRLQLVD